MKKENKNIPKKKKILIVEDNVGDIRLMKEAFNDINADIDIEIVNNAYEVMNKLEEEKRADMIILDLNLPLKNGMEILKEIKSGKYRKIPIIIFSTSDSLEDIMNAYQNHANCYVKKPADFEDFLVSIRRLTDFWIQTVELPS